MPRHPAAATKVHSGWDLTCQLAGVSAPVTVGVSRSNRGEAEGFCLGSHMGWAVWAVCVWTRRAVTRVGVAGGLKCQQWGGWWPPQGAYHRRGRSSSGRVGLALASGLLAALGVCVWGVASLEPGSFSLRQSSGLLQLVPDMRQLYSFLCHKAVTPRWPGWGHGWRKRQGNGQCDPRVLLPCPAPRPPAWHPLEAAGVERAPWRGPCLRKACLPERRLDVCLPLPAAPRAQPLPGVSGSAGDVSIRGPRLVLWKLFAGFTAALGFETPTLALPVLPPTPQSCGGGGGVGGAVRVGEGRSATGIAVGMGGWLTRCPAGHPWLPGSSVCPSLPPFLPIHSHIHSFVLSTGCGPGAVPALGERENGAAVKSRSGSYSWERGSDCNQILSLPPRSLGL